MCNWNENKSMGDEQSILSLPEYLAEYRPNNPDTVCIDKCIQKNIQALWDEKIVTLDCCCGHDKENPTIIIGESHNIKDLPRIVNILASIDNREWAILQWVLTDLTKRQKNNEDRDAF